MKSQWYELKPAVIALRQHGKSLSFIETNLGIPRSTLSAWCKEVSLTAAQRHKLASDKLIGLAKARLIAKAQKQEQKLALTKKAEDEASKTLASITVNNAISELALAILCSKDTLSSSIFLRSTDPTTLQFSLTTLVRSYKILLRDVTCELHLQHGQDAEKEVAYWSKELRLPSENFTYTYFSRQKGNPTHTLYHGECLVRYHGSVAIQHKLAYLYKSFCKEVIDSTGD
jgi:hypothetical protein